MNLSYLPNVGCVLNSSLCNFDASLNTAGLLFLVLVLLGLCLAYSLLRSRTDKPLKHMLILGLGVLLFELFTAPMWNSEHLGEFTYIYNDLSLTLTGWWIVVFMLSIISVNSFFPKLEQSMRFFLYLIPITLSTIVSETLLVIHQVRSYAPEVWQTSVGALGVIPIETLYYAPVFAALVISFYLAWAQNVESHLNTAFQTKNLPKTIVLLVIAITLYELLIEPVAQAPGFPSWSYFYQDISFIRIGLWIVMIFVGTWIGSLLVKNINDKNVFWVYLFSSSLVFYLVEIYLLATKERMYTGSVTSNFTGWTVPLFGTPIEVLLAIFIYLSLIISFLKYWSLPLGKSKR